MLSQDMTNLWLKDIITSLEQVYDINNYLNLLNNMSAEKGVSSRTVRREEVNWACMTLLLDENFVQSTKIWETTKQLWFKFVFLIGL